MRMNRKTQTILPHAVGPGVGQSSPCLLLLFSASVLFLYEKESIWAGTGTSLQAGLVLGLPVAELANTDSSLT